VAATAAEGPEAALSRVRPPVFGPRRTRLAAQARGFGAERLEMALSMITETDLALRSGGAMPGLAMVERLFVRVAMLRPR
jgi:DNA polymerase-3 subunit delta